MYVLCIWSSDILRGNSFRMVQSFTRFPNCHLQRGMLCSMGLNSVSFINLPYGSLIFLHGFNDLFTYYCSHSSGLRRLSLHNTIWERKKNNWGMICLWVSTSLRNVFRVEISRAFQYLGLWLKLGSWLEEDRIFASIKSYFTDNNRLSLNILRAHSDARSTEATLVFFFFFNMQCLK